MKKNIKTMLSPEGYMRSKDMISVLPGLQGTGAIKVPTSRLVVDSDSETGIERTHGVTQLFIDPTKMVDFDDISNYVEQMITAYTQNLGFAVSFTSDEVFDTIRESIALWCDICAFKGAQDRVEYQDVVTGQRLGDLFNAQSSLSGIRFGNFTDLDIDEEVTVINYGTENTSNAQYVREVLRQLQDVYLPKGVKDMLRPIFESVFSNAGYDSPRGVFYQFRRAEIEDSGVSISTLNRARIAALGEGIRTRMNLNPSLSSFMRFMGFETHGNVSDFTRDLAGTTLHINYDADLDLAIANGIVPASIADEYDDIDFRVYSIGGNAQFLDPVTTRVDLTLPEFAKLDVMRMMRLAYGSLIFFKEQDPTVRKSDCIPAGEIDNSGDNPAVNFVNGVKDLTHAFDAFRYSGIASPQARLRFNVLSTGGPTPTNAFDLTGFVTYQDPRSIFIDEFANYRRDYCIATMFGNDYLDKFAKLIAEASSFQNKK